MRAQSEQPLMRTSARRSRRLATVGAVGAAAGVVMLAVLGFVIAATLLGPRGGARAVELHLPDSGGAFASCLPLTVEHLAGMSAAFAGTVTELAENQVVLRVDRWYAGGSASEVVLGIPEGAHAALIGDIEFSEGRRYLITAEGGVVNLCGYSGEATSDLQAAFDAAF